MLKFKIKFRDQSTTVTLNELNSTVEDLKLEIYQLSKIPPSKQILTGSCEIPTTDNILLKVCCEELNELVVEERTAECTEKSCRQIFNNSSLNALLLENSGLYIDLNISDALNETCLTTNLKDRKLLMVLLHCEPSPFMDQFVTYLENDAFMEKLKRKMKILGLNINNPLSHTLIIDALQPYMDVSILCDIFINSKSACLIFIGIDSTCRLSRCFTKVGSYETTVEIFDHIISGRPENMINTEMESEELQNDNNDNHTESSPREFHEFIAEYSTDVDWEFYDFNEHDKLKSKISYALFGPPQNLNGYNYNQNQEADRLMKIILENNNSFAQFYNCVHVMFIFNCVQPELPEDSGFSSYPIFVLKRCSSRQGCRVFIDHIGRIYTSWSHYLSTNILPEGVMTVPTNGRYSYDQNSLMLTRCPSPASLISAKLLRATDAGASLVGMVSGAAFIVSMFTPVMPLIVGAAAVGGAITGVYSTTRSTSQLYDRAEHGQNIGLDNSEARSAYLSIASGFIGIGSAGANVVASRLIAEGALLGQTASLGVNSLNVVNLGINSVNVVNTSFDLYTEWETSREAPSMLSLVQLASSVFFLTSSVYNFRTVAGMTYEIQKNELQSYQNSLRSNRHRRTFNKLLKQTIKMNDGNSQIGNADVIRTVKSINNKDEVFAALTRNNKAMNKLGIRFSASDGKITFNGLAVDMGKFIETRKTDLSNLLTDLSSTNPATQQEIIQTKTWIQLNFKNLSFPNSVMFKNLMVKVLNGDLMGMKKLLIAATAQLLNKLALDHSEMFRRFCELVEVYRREYKIFEIIFEYFGKIINEFDAKYQRWRRYAREIDYDPFFEDILNKSVTKTKGIVNIVIRIYFSKGKLTAKVMDELVGYFATWFTRAYTDQLEARDRETNRRVYSASQGSTRITRCSECGGCYYKRVI